MSEQRLRTALRELGDVPPPVDLASGALARARRDRRRRGVALTAAVALGVVTAITVPAALRTRADAPPATPAPEVWLSCYETIGPGAGISPARHMHCYDATTGRYRDYPRPGAITIDSVSPDGSRAVIARDETGGPRMAIVRLDRLAAGLTEADWQQPRLPPASWQWSPDGSRLLSGNPVDQPTEAWVLDVRTRAVTEVPLRLDELSSGSHGLGWGPGGRGFVTWPTRTNRPGPGELVVHDEAGQPTRRYPLRGPVQTFQLSPDGARALVVTIDAKTNEQAQLLDLATGSSTTLALPPDHWYDDRHLIRIDTAQRGDSSIVVVEPEDERVLRRTTLPVADGTRLVGVVVARGTAPPGAIVP